MSTRHNTVFPRCCRWTRRSGVLGKSTMLAQQLSQRGGELEVEVGGEEEEGASARVWIRGHAVTTLAGELLIPPPRTVPVVSRLC
mmetsp:Transcript_8961/g.26423  ORF Transcript_8961/g.26423 Transcript_8961/m.26423 type:complete len:85 (-) Transcript_8961:410-664(-)